MKGLWHSIAPFSTDVSGACAVFQHARALVIAQDSNGAVSNLRRVIDISAATADFETLDMPEVSFTLGREDDFQARLNELLDFNRQIVNPFDPRTRMPYELAVLVNGPVPTLLGTDLAMRARLFEEASGLPTLAVQASGNKYYDHGIAAAYRAIYERFVLPASEEKKSAGPSFKGNRLLRGVRSVNVIGATELDWPGNQLYDRLKGKLNDTGERIASTFGYHAPTSDWQDSILASRNIVASSSGLALARSMESDLGIPFVTLDELDIFDDWVEGIALKETPRVLVLGEAITSRLVRRLLLRAGAASVDIATFFMFDRALRERGDKRLAGEADLHELLAQGEYDLVIGDAIFEPLSTTRYFALMHPPVGFGARDDSELSRAWFEALARWWNGDAATSPSTSRASTGRRRLSELDL